MSRPLLTSYSPQTGMRQRVLLDADGRTIFVSKQDTRDIIDDNKRMASMFDPWAVRGKPRMIANIPNVVMLRLRKLGITPQKDPVAFRKWLSSPEARFFRVDGGRPLA